MQVINVAVIRINPVDRKFAYALLPIVNGQVSHSGKVFEWDDDSRFPDLGIDQMILGSQLDDLQMIKLTKTQVTVDNLPVYKLSFETMTAAVHGLVYEEYLKQADELWPDIRKEIFQ
jgi:hypothetical protein